MRITKRRIKLMQHALSHLIATSEDKGSSEWEADSQKAQEIIEAVECFEELIRRVERQSKRREDRE